jgi:hypothetical protein
MRCTSQVSGSAEINRMPHAFSASYTRRELAVETGDMETARSLAYFVTAVQAARIARRSKTSNHCSVVEPHGRDVTI